jgi:DNA repair exonuclease SbcCD ATPase subunit
MSALEDGLAAMVAHHEEVVAAFDAQAAEATISYEALERQREATKTAEAEVEALRTEVERQRNLWSAIRDSRTDAAEARALAAESSLAEVTRERDEEAANSRSKRLVVQSLREQLVTLESSLAEAVGALREILSIYEDLREFNNASYKDSGKAVEKVARALLTKLAAKETK